MGKVTFMMSVSLDGYMSGPNGELDWHRVDEELHQHFNDFLAPMAAFLEGRRTYELMEDYWPTADQQPDSTPPEREFAGIWRDKPKVVFSTTLESVGPNATLERSVVPERIAELTKAGDVGVGGANLAVEFIRQGLIDEYRLYMHPVVLGEGLPTFAGNLRQDLRLAETHTFSNGVVLLRYERR